MEKSVRPMIRKTFAATLALSAAVSLAACGGEDSGNSAAVSCPQVELPEDLGSSGNIGWINESADARDAGQCLTAADARAYVDQYKSSESAATTTEAPEPTTSSASPNTSSSPSSSASTNSRSGTSAQSATVDDGQVQQRKVFRDSESFAYLDERGGVQPGAKYIIERSDGTAGSCSFGWSVGPKNDTSKLYNLTAGHCGEVGDRVFAFNKSGQRVQVGQFVMSQLDGTKESIGPGADYALISFNSNVNNAVGTPSVAFDGRQVNLAGWAGADWLQENKPYMCRIGYRSGLSCGNYQAMTSAMSVMFDNISDHGDSGGAIFALDPTDQNAVYAVAVNSYMRTVDATSAGGKIVEPMMNEYGLQIYS